jgi:hypothetical protein
MIFELAIFERFERTAVYAGPAWTASTVHRTWSIVQFRVGHYRHQADPRPELGRDQAQVPTDPAHTCLMSDGPMGYLAHDHLSIHCKTARYRQRTISAILQKFRDRFRSLIHARPAFDHGIVHPIDIGPVIGRGVGYLPDKADCVGHTLTSCHYLIDERDPIKRGISYLCNTKHAGRRFDAFPDRNDQFGQRHGLNP